MAASSEGKTVDQAARYGATLVVTPTYDEYANLPALTQSLWAALPGAHLLVVDDASGDGTPDWVRAHPEFGQTLHLLERPAKQGLGTAYLAGFAWGLRSPMHYQYFLQIDADLQHDPAEAPLLFAALDEGAELVLTSRYVGGVRVLNWPLQRLALSLAAAAYVRVLTGLPLTDPTSGYKLWKRDVLECLDFSAIESNGYAFQIETSHWAWRMGVKLQEVPIIFEGRHAGSSKMSGEITREAVFEVLKLALRRGAIERRQRWPQEVA